MSRGKTVKEYAEDAIPRGEGISFEEFDSINQAPYAVEGNDTSHYVGVSPEYRTYASDVDAPHAPDDGSDAGKNESADAKAAVKESKPEAKTSSTPKP